MLLRLAHAQSAEGATQSSPDREVGVRPVKDAEPRRWRHIYKSCRSLRNVSFVQNRFCPPLLPGLSSNPSMSSQLYRKAGELSSLHQPFALATVVRVEGSSSAKRGSKALIDEHGKIILGWVGGGCAESANAFSLRSLHSSPWTCKTRF